jgi:hypothetical protein
MALRRDRREVESPAGMLREPCADLPVLVSRLVIDNGVDRLSLGNVHVDVIEGRLLMPVARHVAADNGAVENGERGEQRGHAVAFVIVCHRPGRDRASSGGPAG